MIPNSDCPVDLDTGAPTARGRVAASLRLVAGLDRSASADLLALVGPGPVPTVRPDPSATGRLRGLCE